MTRWSISALSAVAVAGAVGLIYQKLYADPERVIVSLKDVNAKLAEEAEEYGRHAMEEPTKHELFEDADGALGLRVYADHCVLIQRRLRNGGVLTKLIPDLARVSRVRARGPEVGWPEVTPAVHAAEQGGCNRGCINPHPGPFRSWYGAQRGEWIEVWRQWPEGCTHVQMLNPRYGVWDSNSDGSPRVRWTCCVH